MRAVVVYVPEWFDASILHWVNKVAGSQSYNRRCKANYLMSLISRRDEGSGVPVYSQLLRRLIGDSYAELLRELRSLGFIVQYQYEGGYQYSPAMHQSKLYGMAEVATEFKPVKLGGQIVNSLAAYHKQEELRTMQELPVSLDIKRNLRRLRVNKDIEQNVRNSPAYKPEHEYYLDSFKGMRSGNFVPFTYIKDTGRLYHPVICSKKEYRQVLYLPEGGELVNADISNSQPLIIGALIRRHLPELWGRDPEYEWFDYTEPEHRERKYWEVVCGGRFYHSLVPGYEGMSDQERDRAKKAVLSVLYGDISVLRHSPIGQAIEREFPALYGLLEYHKKKYGIKGANCLSLEASRVEGDIIFDRVIPELIRRDIWYIPMHDGLMIERQYEEIVRCLMVDAVISELVIPNGFTPLIKIK